MIARLCGEVVECGEQSAVIDVGGVGYEVTLSARARVLASKRGTRLELLTHLIVREDAHTLYGFASGEEREAFRTLIRVSGVGPRLALALLSGMTPGELARALADKDIARLVRVPGIGRRIAERIHLEVRDTLAHLIEVESTAAAGNENVIDAERALVALGYRQTDATRAARHVAATAPAGLPIAEIVRRALRVIGER